MNCVEELMLRDWGGDRIQILKNVFILAKDLIIIVVLTEES